MFTVTGASQVVPLTQPVSTAVFVVSPVILTGVIEILLTRSSVVSGGAVGAV